MEQRGVYAGPKYGSEPKTFRITSKRSIQRRVGRNRTCPGAAAPCRTGHQAGLSSPRRRCSRRTWRCSAKVIESTLRLFCEAEGEAVHARHWRRARRVFAEFLPNPRFGFDSTGSTDIIFPWQQCQRSRRLPEAKFEPTDSSAKAEGEIGSKLASVLFFRQRSAARTSSVHCAAIVLWQFGSG